MMMMKNLLVSLYKLFLFLYNDVKTKLGKCYHILGNILIQHNAGGLTITPGDLIQRRGIYDDGQNQHHRSRYCRPVFAKGTASKGGGAVTVYEKDIKGGSLWG